MWKPDEVIEFSKDCISNGVKAVSLGGGEPLEYDGVFDIIDALYTECYLSVTTNGLPLMDDSIWARLMIHKPDKVHITIHSPDNNNEVERVMGQIRRLTETDIKPGVNMLVGADKIEAAGHTYRELMRLLTPDQVIVIPQRYHNTPTPIELARVAGRKPFQGPACLLGCKRPTNFVSVTWDKKVNSCSYAYGKQKLGSLDYRGMCKALEQVKWLSCTKNI